jgi:hypothetical protein
MRLGSRDPKVFVGDVEDDAERDKIERKTQDLYT